MTQGLRLRLLRSHGRDRTGVFSIPANGAGLALALELAGDVFDEAQRRETEQCRIECQGQAWTVVNRSRSLVATLNGQRVMNNGPAQELKAGDALELGWHAFQVDAIEATIARHPPTAVAERIDSLHAEMQSEPAPAHFDLSTLAEPEPGLHGHLQDDPFAALGIAGTSERNHVDVLAKLLGEAPPPKPHNNTIEPWQAPKLNASATAEERLVAELGAEFLRVLHDPSALGGSFDAKAAPSRSAEWIPTLADYMRKAATYNLMGEILEPRGSIEQLLDSFDTSGTASWMEVIEPEDVLGLFAGDLARHANPPMPRVTRVDHHSLSPDSHVQFGASARTDGTATIDDGSHWQIDFALNEPNSVSGASAVQTEKGDAIARPGPPTPVLPIAAPMPLRAATPSIAPVTPPPPPPPEVDSGKPRWLQND